MTELDAHALPTTYTVSCLPEDDHEAHAWAITVEWRGSGSWAVKHGAYCLGSGNTWSYEMRPSSREDDWLTTHRFPLEEALRLAKQAAPHITVNGLTPAGLIQWRLDRAAAGRESSEPTQ
jgi:hypothetical protein